MRLWFCFFKFLMPRPPVFLFIINSSHLTRWNFFLSSLPCHRKSLPRESMILDTLAGIGNIDII
uniref:Putative ovule protein n=1 Tax=Solanum chacoense TaxID=4108 RepID=A0A0V0GNT9_SOLCH